MKPTDTKEMRDPMNEQDSRRGKGKKGGNRSSILWAICGAYLL